MGLSLIVSCTVLRSVMRIFLEMFLDKGESISSYIVSAISTSTASENCCLTSWFDHLIYNHLLAMNINSNLASCVS